MPTCCRCLLPSSVPGSALDDQGVCAFCRAYDGSARIQEDERRAGYERDLELALRDCRGRGSHDCLVCFSGGKDSVYLLYKLKKEYGLNVLAFTCDLDIPAVGWENIRRTVDRLDLPHLVFKPPMGMYRKFFKYLLKNQGPEGAVKGVCYISAPLTEGYALRLAVERNIPLILAGYSPGQPDPDWMLYEMSRRRICQTDWTPPVLRDNGVLDSEELRYFWNPKAYPAQTSFPRFLAPFHAWPYQQQEIMEKVAQLGLVAGKRGASPLHSNSPFQWLLMYSDLKHLGYNPYAPEFCRLIREGRAQRRFWRFAFPAMNFMIRRRIFLGRYVTQTCRWLDLPLEELAMRAPQAAPVADCVRPARVAEHRMAELSGRRRD